MRDDQLGDDLEHLVTDLFPGGVVGLDGQVARSLCLRGCGTAGDLAGLPRGAALGQKLGVDVLLKKLLGRLGGRHASVRQVGRVVDLRPHRACEVAFGQLCGSDDQHGAAVVLHALVVGGAEDRAQPVVVMEGETVAARRHLMGPHDEADELVVAELQGDVGPEAHEATASRGNVLTGPVLRVGPQAVFNDGLRHGGGPHRHRGAPWGHVPQRRNHLRGHAGQPAVHDEDAGSRRAEEVGQGQRGKDAAELLEDVPAVLRVFGDDLVVEASATARVHEDVLVVAPVHEHGLGEHQHPTQREHEDLDGKLPPVGDVSIEQEEVASRFRRQPVAVEDPQQVLQLPVQVSHHDDPLSGGRVELVHALGTLLCQKILDVGQQCHHHRRGDDGRPTKLLVHARARLSDVSRHREHRPRGEALLHQEVLARPELVLHGRPGADRLLGGRRFEGRTNLLRQVRSSD
mmetsp:Transcript_41745/g.118191  ORF Transcript_41745/g.118191 Transcript_41745/m.118191 type:complete len:459 (+) Transcript_41745:1212-2588(+)